MTSRRVTLVLAGLGVVVILFIGVIVVVDRFVLQPVH